jgi:hypothetical protein
MAALREVFPEVEMVSEDFPSLSRWKVVKAERRGENLCRGPQSGEGGIRTRGAV